MSLLFVMPYHSSKERARFRVILEHWDQLVQIQMPFGFLFVGPSEEPLHQRFPYRCLVQEDPPGMKPFRCVSRQWATVAEYVERNVDCRCWFWWEWDALPVRPDCFEFLLSLWRPQTEIMGYHVQDNKWGMRHCINGVAFYSKRYWSYIQPCFDWNGTFDSRKKFDPLTEGHRFVALNQWYALVHHEKRLRLTPSLRLVHGIKDTSLLDQMLQGRRRFVYLPDWYRKMRTRLRIISLSLRPWSLPPPES